MQNKTNSQVRIIAGKWRSRKITFPNKIHIRPTTDRIRETVFNWLTPYTQNANCLDAFAGSGVLSFESLSRGANHVTMIDYAKENIMAIKNMAEKCQLSKLQINAWLKKTSFLTRRIGMEHF